MNSPIILILKSEIKKVKSMSRFLTKSRFKLALECPNKLYYTKNKEYASQQLEDPFLQALAEGGFQVEELARLEYLEGVLIEDNDCNYDIKLKGFMNIS